MSWDVEFYDACNTDASFVAGITDFFREHKENAVAPFARYELITALGTPDLESVGLEGEHNIQLTVWSSSPRTSESLVKNAYTGVNDQLNLMSVYGRSLGFDAEEKLFGYAMDFVVWFDNP